MKFKMIENLMRKRLI